MRICTRQAVASLITSSGKALARWWWAKIRSGNNRWNWDARSNQTFVQIPHARLIDILRYKAILAGIKGVIVEESYTSKASLLDLDTLPIYDPERTEKP